jgi:uncharacterized protein with PIN domain
MSEPIPTLPQPEMDSVRGRCPRCGAPVVAVTREEDGAEAVTVWICWARLHGERCVFEERL